MDSATHEPGPFRFAVVMTAIWMVLACAVDFLVFEGWDARSGLAVLFFSILWGLPAGLFIGLALWAGLGGDSPVERTRRSLGRVFEFLRAQDPEATDRFVALSCGLGFWLLLSLVASILVNDRIATRVVTTHFQAILSTGTVFAALLFLAPVGLIVRRLVGGVLGLVRGRFDRSLLGDRPVYWAGGVSLLFLLAGTWLFVSNFETVRLSHWHLPVQLLLSLLVAVALTVAGFKAARVSAVGWTVVVLAGLMVGGGGLAALTLPENDARVRNLLLEGRMTGLLYGALNSALDFDDDGFMGAFAGGDCAPSDPSIYPGAIDIPDNGIDEDCSGGDVEDTGALGARWDYPIPLDGSWSRKRLPVIIVTSDALSSNHVGFLGYDRDTTPNLDKLSRSCVSFDKAFSQGPSTRISLPSFFTSLYDTQTDREPTGKNPYPFAPDNLTMAEVLMNSGYDTVAVVPKWYFTSTWKGILQGFSKVDKTPIKHYKKKKGRIHNAKWVTKAAIKHLNKKRRKPLFMWVHYYDNHFPYRQPKGAKRYGKKRKDIYDAEVRYWDSQVKPLFDAIRKKYRKTGYLLIVTSDHGSAFDERHPRFANGYDLYTSTLHIPMLWCSPALEPRRVKDVPAHLMDILPTLVNLVPLRGEFKFEGTSLAPLLFGNAGSGWDDRAVFHQYFLFEKTIRKMDPLFMAAVRTAKYNYIWDRRKDRRELYDYTTDPFETENLIEDEPELADGMHSMLQSWLFRVHRKYNPDWKEAPEEGDEEGDEEYDEEYDDD